ncbi:sugar phosphate isomerase/epimerase family protein [Streptomyces sp. NBC_01439]|uniref:sugar phosphate isomerase/epimerase family protein n=1 Tax=Streptomyces sp. NBC_01439 TaxID=2903867 RepID=UPI002E2E3B2D|nr:sugar phosphate isomerase/epimerase [Streptomyces sp. NBC_01439]
MLNEGWRDRLSVIGDECGFTWEQQIANTEALGLKSIELRSVAGRSLGAYAWPETEDMARSLADAGLSVVALDSPVGAGSIAATTLEEDLATAERWLELACLFGTPSVRVMSYGRAELTDEAWQAESVRRLLALRDLAKAYDRRLLHENCVGWGGRDAASAELFMREAGDEHLAFLMDTGNGVWYGYDSVEMAGAVLPYVRHVHIKDARLREGEAVPCLPGEGRARVADTLALVLSEYPEMTLSLEPHLLVQPHLGIQCEDGEALYKSVAACIEGLTG